MDADTNDLASNGFGNCLTRDGQGVATANLPMASFRHTGVGNGVARTDYAALGQTQDGKINWVAAGGTADAITATYSPALTALVDGQLCYFRASAANATTTPSFAPNGLTAHTITKMGGSALLAGDIPGALAECVVRYNLANTRWELQNPAVGIPAANSITSAMLQAGAVLYAKIQNVTNGRLLGNFTGSGAAPSEYSLGNGLAVASTTINNTALPPAGAFKNLSIKVATTTTVAVAADTVVMTDGSGGYRSAAISATCDLGSNGAVNKLDAGTIAIDTWYFIWAISNGTTDGTLASTSSTAPTMPSGYTFKARIGAVQTCHATATLYGTWQFGRIAQYVQGLASNTPNTSTTPGLVAPSATGTASTTSPTLTATTVTGNGKYVPTTASRILLLSNTNYKAGGPGIINIAPSSAYSGANNGPAGSNGLMHPYFGSGVNTDAISVWLTLESSSVYVATGAGATIGVFGWEDNL